MLILHKVRERVLTEFRLYKEGPDLRRGDPKLEKDEEPLRGFIHGKPGTGKSRVILWIRRLFYGGHDSTSAPRASPAGQRPEVPTVYE